MSAAVVRAIAAAGAVFLGASLAPGDARAKDEILFYSDGGHIVFTNTPSRSQARPVPGLRSLTLALPANLPATSFDPFIREVAREEGLDPSLIKAVALVESGFNPRAVSPKGARGLMQLMPDTAKRYGVRDPHDPHESLRAGARHLRDLLDEFDGDLTLALAAYNAGSGAVRRHGGVPAYAETRAYVSKVRQRLGDAGSARSSGIREARPGGISVQRGADGSILLSN